MDQLDAFERNVLKIARQFFESFARPGGHAWIKAFQDAEHAFPAPFGATIANAILISINEMRMSRRNMFSFERSTSAFASSSLTDTERYFMLALHDVRRKNWGSARAHALVLCEGNEVSRLLAALERLAIITGDAGELHFN